MRIKESKIKHIMSQYSYRSKKIINLKELREYRLNKLLGKKVKDLEVFYNVNPNSKEHFDRMLVYSYYYKLGKNDDEIRDIWLQTQSEKRSRQKGRDIMPKEGKDNQNPVTNTINYKGGGGNRNTIRVPSKKHKNRFKNFKKLFPEYCERKGL
jgi:hypothetical protein